LPKTYFILIFTALFYALAFEEER
jgi:hypothetical protein